MDCTSQETKDFEDEGGGRCLKAIDQKRLGKTGEEILIFTESMARLLIPISAAI